MDPVSILGIVGTALSIAKEVTHAIQKLGDLKSRYRNVPLQVSTLIGQLYIVQAALEQISSWSTQDLLSSPRYQELAVQIDTSLDCFCPLILTLQQHLDELNLPQDLDLTARSKISFLWNEQDLMGYLNLLDCQVNALNLFLQAIQWCVLSPPRSMSTFLIGYVARLGQTNRISSMTMIVEPSYEKQKIVTPRSLGCLITRVSSPKAPTSTPSALNSISMHYSLAPEPTDPPIGRI